MRKTLTIGEKEIALASNAATAILYKQTFHEDLLKSVFNISTAPGEELEAVEKVQKLAFIMNKQASDNFSTLIGKLTENDFIEWLCGFEESDFQTVDVIIGVLSAWNKNFQSSSESKNA